MEIQQPLEGINIDISDLYLCIYDDEKVGLFSRKQVEVKNDSGDISQIEVYSCFEEMNNPNECHIGIMLDEIKGTKTPDKSYPIRMWQPKGLTLNKDNRYTANCSMYGALKFEHAYERITGQSLSTHLVPRETVALVLKALDEIVSKNSQQSAETSAKYIFKYLPVRPVRIALDSGRVDGKIKSCT